MKVSVITAFPEIFENFLAASIIGRAVKNGLIDVRCVSLREFGFGNYRQIDDYSFGSGGMVLMAGPLKRALESVPKGYVVCPSPQGKLFSHEMVKSLSGMEHVVIVCGHYEGIDERFVERYVDLEMSIGDAVLSGGEIPAMALIDAMARLVPDVVGSMSSVTDDSFFHGMLDHPHYTRPAVWDGAEVPAVLTSGNASEVSEWRRKQAVKRTLERRIDIVDKADIRAYIESNCVFISNGAAGDLSSVLLSCKEMKANKLFLVSKTSFDGFKKVRNTAQAAEWILRRSGSHSFIVDLTSSEPEDWGEMKKKLLKVGVPILFIFSLDEKFWETKILAVTVKKLRSLEGK